MPCLTQDPNLAEKPDFTSGAYDAVCQALTMAEGSTREAVAACLSDAWDVDNNIKIAAWEQQLREDQEEEDEATCLREAAEQLESEEHRKADEAERKEKEKKKPKLKDLAMNKAVRDTTQLCPSRFTLHKLEDCDYVELHYFTLEGCTEATKHNRTIAQDTFTFTKADDTLLLKLMASHKPSNKVTPDEELTWRQMSIAKTTLLHHMGRTGWPKQHIMALAECYLNLESHPMRLQTDGDTILLHYQAQVHQEWHEVIQSTGDEPAFDISLINNRCVDAITTDLWNARCAEGVLRSVPFCFL